ncbi:MAG: sigma-54 dependent transcriptional regulator [Alkalispirochaeta sp.]
MSSITGQYLSNPTVTFRNSYGNLFLRMQSQSEITTPMRILIVDDEPANNTYVSRVLRNHETRAFDNPQDALDFARDEAIDLVVVDQRMVPFTGLELVHSLKEIQDDFVAIVVSAYTDRDDLMDAVNSNLIYRYLVKPVSPEDLLEAAEKALMNLTLVRKKRELEAMLRSTNAQLTRENKILRAGEKDPLGEFFGFHERIQKLKDILRIYAATEEPILITGETGTGKELLARSVHRLSSRRDGPFFAINCSAIPKQIFESELFGHEKGAFTDAQHARPGFVTAADGGTLFLDEIGDLPLEVQPKVLRFLQFGTYFPLGSRSEHKTSIRIVTATNRDLETEVNEGRFRQDLWYRMNTLRVSVPPLRERSSDILPLMDALAVKKGVILPNLTNRARRLLRSYSFPGNVRELEAVVVKLHVFAGALGIGEIDAASLADILELSSSSIPGCIDEPIEPFDSEHGEDLRTYIEAVEREAVQRAFHATGGNLSETARVLGLTRHGLRNKLRRHGLYPFQHDEGGSS